MEIRIEEGKEELQSVKIEQPKSALVKNIFKDVSLPAVLRVAGASVLVTAAATFLLQDWGSLNHNLRYFAFLAFSIVLTLAGFLCGIRIRDSRGARTFLGVVAGIVPVHFAALGGLLFSQFGVKAGQHYPELLRWVATSPVSAISTTLAGVVTLSALTYISFLSLARAEAKRLTPLYIGVNALLLVPTRTPEIVALMAFAGLGVVAYQELTKFIKSPAMRTGEGKLIRLMLLVPGTLMIGRSLFLYSMSDALLAVMYGVAAAVLFSIVPRYVGRAAAVFCQYASLVPAFIASILVSKQLMVVMPALFDYHPMITGLPFACLLAYMSTRALEGGSFLRKQAALIAIASMSIQMVFLPGVASSLMFVIASVLTLCYGHSTEQKGIFMYGAIGLAFGLFYHVRLAVIAYSVSPWLGLALIGTAIVIGSSILEQHGKALKALVTVRLENLSR